MERCNNVVRLVFMALVAGLIALPSLAQSPTGEIRGTISDPQGAVVPKAAVTIMDTATGRQINLTTNSEGLFVASALVPGTYKVTVKASGFSTEEREIVLQAGQTVDTSLKLAIGSTGQTVEVGAMVAQLQVDTSRSTVDGVVTAQQIDQMPLNARNFLDLAMQEPGVIVRNGSAIDPTKTGAYRTVGLMGRSGTGTRVTIDGMDVTDETVGTTTANISDDAVQEFQLSQSSLDLSTSLTSTGAVSIVPRSGGNQIHGSAFDFYRNQDMGARLAFLSTSQPFHRHQVGFRVGGPFVQNKLFWFANWERTYQGEQGISTSDNNFPTVAGHNCTSGCPAANPTGIRYLMGRADWNVKSDMRLHYMFNHDWNIATGGTIPFSPFQNVDWTNMHVIGFDVTQGRLSHSIRAGYLKFNNRIITQAFSGFAFPTTANGIPYELSVGSYSFGPNSLAPQTTAQDNYNTKYDGSYVVANHTIRYGGEFDHIRLGGFANFAGPLSFSGTFDSTTQKALNFSTNPLDYPLSDFSMGPDNGFFTVDSCDNFKYGCHKNNRIAWYAGDNWKMRHNLTVNFGTRWEYDTGYFNNENNVARPGWLDYFLPGASKHPSMGWDKFGPEAGFAWDPMSTGKTVIRGGAKMAYEMNIYNNLLFDQGALIPPGIGPDSYTSSFVGIPQGGQIVALTPAMAGIAIGSLPGSCQSAAAQAAMNTGVYSCMLGAPISSVVGPVGALTATLKSAYNSYKFDPSAGQSLLVGAKGNVSGALIGGSQFKIPYSLQYNIGVQREIHPGHLLTVDFLVNHGVHMGFLELEQECRGCASTLNVAAAAAKIKAKTGSTAAPGSAQWQADTNTWLASPAGAGKTITTFAFGGDTVFQGRTPDPSASDPVLQTTNFQRMRIMGDGGFTKYMGIHASLRGNLTSATDLGFVSKVLKSSNYIISYAYGLNKATQGTSRPEFLTLVGDKFNATDPNFFGEDSLSWRHMLTGGISLGLPFGFRISNNFNFHTAPPGTLFMPTLGVTGSNGAMFSMDYLGEGGSGTTPLSQPLPGTHIGEFNRGINSWADVNAAIAAYNGKFAGTLTPAGQAMVKAGLFTQAQLVSLKAFMPTIASVPTTNPWPFQNFFDLDTALTRPIKLSRIREGMSVEPWIQFFNVLNYNSLGTYSSSSTGGLGGAFGSLNFDYANSTCTGFSSCTQSLAVNTRGRQNQTRLFQIGVRFNF